MGKGSKQRPRQVSYKQYSDSWDKIFKKGDKYEKISDNTADNDDKLQHSNSKANL